jgi:hypothetical protein
MVVIEVQTLSWALWLSGWYLGPGAYVLCMCPGAIPCNVTFCPNLDIVTHVLCTLITLKLNSQSIGACFWWV